MTILQFIKELRTSLNDDYDYGFSVFDIVRVNETSIVVGKYYDEKTPRGKGIDLGKNNGFTNLDVIGMKKVITDFFNNDRNFEIEVKE